MKVFIDSNCPEKQLFVFDMLATVTGLYKAADVVLDASESGCICYPLNTAYTVVLSSKTKKIGSPELAFILDDFYRNNQIKGVCLKDNCEEFLKNAFDKFFPIDTYDALNLSKEFSLENISRSDILLLREQLKLGILQPYYIKLPRVSEVLYINADGTASYADKESCEISADFLNSFIAYAVRKEKMSDKKASTLIDALENDITPVYYDENIDIFNEKVTLKAIVNYKKKFIKFLKKIAKENNYRNFITTNKNTLMLIEIITTNQSLFNSLYGVREEG